MSPKNKGKFGKAKSSVEVEDEFVSTMGRVANVLKPHAITIAVAAVAALVIIAGVSTYRWWSAQKGKAATALLTQAVTILQTPVVAPPDPETHEAGEGEDGEAPAAEPPAPAAPAPAPDEDGDGIPDSFPSHQERAKAALVPLDALRKHYGSTDIADEAALLRASALYELGQLDDAMAMYKAFLASSGNQVLVLAARERIGYILETQAMKLEDAQAREAKLSEALAAFRSIQSADDGPERDRALYHEARVLAAQGKAGEAKAALERALELEPESVLSYDIKQRLAQLEATK